MPTNSKILARDFLYEIESSDGQYTPIRGLTDVSTSPTKNDADTTDYDTGGWVSHLVASRGYALTLSGQRVEDPYTGERDPGQEAVEVAALSTGYDSMVGFRVSSRVNDMTYIEGQVSIEITPLGGGNDAPAAWDATVTFDGEPTFNFQGNGNGNGGDNGGNGGGDNGGDDEGE